MAQSPRRITSADVARASGVSRATVSYVLNNDLRQSIPQETREKVLKAARQLGYHPFAAARVLRAGYSRIVLAVLPFEQIDPGLSRSLRDLETGLAEKGFTLISYVGVHSAAGSTHPASNLTPAVVAAFTNEAEADSGMTAFMREFNLPIVWMHTPGYGAAVGEAQVEYLVQRGYGRIVFAAPERADVQPISRSRLAGVRRKCAELGLPEPSEHIVPLSRQGATVATGSLLTQNTLPLGVCCYNDEIAIAIMSGLQEAGAAVPESVGVIGCDDIPLAQFSLPALTTVRITDEDQRRLRETQIENILAASRGEPLHEIPVAQLTVVARQSA